MKRFIIVMIMLVMFFATGVRMDFGNDFECPDWLEIIMSEDEGSAVDMTHHPIYQIATSHMRHRDDEPDPPSAK